MRRPFKPEAATKSPTDYKVQKPAPLKTQRPRGPSACADTIEFRSQTFATLRPLLATFRPLPNGNEGANYRVSLLIVTTDYALRFLSTLFFVTGIGIVALLGLRLYANVEVADHRRQPVESAGAAFRPTL